MSIIHTPKRAALITGVAGTIGSKLADHLAAQNRQLIGLYRNKLPSSHKNVLPLCSDLMSTDSIHAPLKSTDTVIHLAWQGGVLGAASSRTVDSTDEDIRSSQNVIMTINLVRAMERVNARKIIFLSWVGVDRKSPNTMLREKYWAENAVINSSIPEKIIIRAGILSGSGVETEFYKAADSVTKLPMFLPLPLSAEGLVLTTMQDIFWAIDEALKVSSGQEAYCRVVDLTSTSPTTGAALLAAMDSKKRGKRRLTLGGFLGDLLFRWAVRKFGTAKINEPRITDFFDAGRLLEKSPAEGIPATRLGMLIGHPTDVTSAL